MFNWHHLLIGLIFAAIGTALLKFNFRLVGYTGRQDWIEDHLGSGTTYFAYQIMAIAVAVFGLLYATGFGDNVASWLLSPIRGIFVGLR